MSSTLQIYLLGDVHLSLNDTPLTGLKSRTVEGLCIYLACHQKPVAREILYTLFWPTTPEKQAKANLRGALSYLRKHIADHLQVTRQTIGFDHSKKQFVDAHQFESEMEKLLLETNVTAVSPNQANKLRTCLDLYRGDFLQGFTLDFALGFDEWAVIKRERLHWLAVQGLNKLVNHYLMIGSYQAALRYNSRHLQIDPLDEQVHHQQMWLHTRLGDRHKALSQYKTCQQILQKEFNLVPTQTTTAAYQKIQQIELPPPCQLPTYVTPFFGRKGQVQSIVERFLHAENHGMLTLLGIGGCGKSRLAAQAAAHLARYHPGRYLDGIYFISLIAIDNLDSLSATLAVQLDIKLSSSEPIIKQLINHLQTREMLLILDNFEHLSDNEPIFDFLIHLTAEAPAIRLLITSRERLLLQAEQIMYVDGLAYPQTQPADNIAYEAGQLFQNRAVRITGNNKIATENMPAVWQICQAVEGIPIAIELAAGAAWQKSIQQIALDIQENIDLLATNMRDLAPRHRSIRAVFDHTWALLSPHEQQTLARLSIFPATFSYQAAREITAAHHKDLRVLTDKSLLRDLDAKRYDLHPLIKTFAAEKLMGKDKWLQKHAHFYLTWLADLEDTISSAQETQVVADIAQDYSNVILAWRTALNTGNLTLLTKTIFTLHSYFSTKGGFVTGEKLFRESADQIENSLGTYESLNATQALALAQLRSRQGRFLFQMGRPDQGLALLRESSIQFRRLSAYPELATALYFEASILRVMGEFEKARGLLHECLDLRRREENGHLIAAALLNLANATRALGDVEDAEKMLLEAREISKVYDNASLTAAIANDLGIIAHERGNWNAANQHFKEGLASYTKLDDTFRMGISYANLGEVAHIQKDYAAAKQLAEESIKLFTQANSNRLLYSPLSTLGRTATDEGKPEEALAWFREALMVANDHRAIAKLLIVMYEMTFPLHSLGHTQLAVAVLVFLKNQARLDKTDQPKVVAQLKSLAAKADMLQAQTQAGRWSLQDAVDTLLVS